MKKFWKRTEGFTLVELIVVIAILGILAGVGTVGYSGYVKKANMAADQALLDEINTAFATACIVNGEDYYNRNDVPTLETDNNCVTGLALTDKEKIVAAFGELFENEASQFKVMNPAQLVYDGRIGGFKAPGVITSGGVSVSGADVDAYKASAFVNLETEMLLSNMDGVVQFALGKMDSNELLVNVREEGAFKTLRAELIPDYDELTADEKARADMNLLVFYTAQNSQGISKTEAFEKIKQNSGNLIVAGATDSEKIAYNAMMYASGLAYADYLEKNNDPNGDLGGKSVSSMTAREILDLMKKKEMIPDPNDPWGDEVPAPTTGFQDWINAGNYDVDDLSGYLAAMKMISENTGNINMNGIQNGGFFNTGEFQNIVDEILQKNQ